MHMSPHRLVGRSRPMLSVALLLIAACQAEHDPASQTIVRDSAGNRIVENVLPTADGRTVWRLSAAPIMQLGVIEGDPAFEFRIISGAVRLSDGTIVVANTGSSELRAYGTDGQHVWSSGRDGEGPGEYHNIGWIAVLEPDTLVVYDRSLRRVSFIAGDGQFARQVRLESPGGRLRHPPIEPSTRQPDRLYLRERPESNMPATPLHRVRKSRRQR